MIIIKRICRKTIPNRERMQDQRQKNNFENVTNGKISDENIGINIC